MIELKYVRTKNIQNRLFLQMIKWPSNLLLNIVLFRLANHPTKIQFSQFYIQEIWTTRFNHVKNKTFSLQLISNWLLQLIYKYNWTKSTNQSISYCVNVYQIISATQINVCRFFTLPIFDCTSIVFVCAGVTAIQYISFIFLMILELFEKKRSSWRKYQKWSTKLPFDWSNIAFYFDFF